MKAILVLMDTLRKDYLKTYNPESPVQTPHLDAFASDALTFDNHYIGSTPCMPARRDLLTGRLNFLERSWGPVEPFDVTFPKLLQDNNIFSHLTTDHNHYFRLGGEGYINQYTTWDFHRGQEGDPWKSIIRDPEWMPEQYYGRLRKQYQANREHWTEDENAYPTPRTFRSACEWLEDNKAEDDFFLQVEVFDPHEPFDVPESYMNLYDEVGIDRYFETPEYKGVEVPDEAVDYIRKRYSALVTMTDTHFGKFIHKLKDLGLYDETLIIVTSDHGYFLGDRSMFGKNYMHNYNELAAIPLMVKHPAGKRKGEQTANVTQNIDIMPTLLDYFGIQIPTDVRGVSWQAIFDGQSNTKTTALYGAHGITVNITDGQHTYFRAPNEDNAPLFEYGSIPTTIRHYLGKQKPIEIEMGRYFKRTDYPMYKVPIKCAAILDGLGDMREFTKESLLFNIETDPQQLVPLQDSSLEEQYKELLIKEMLYQDTPMEQFERLDLDYKPTSH